MNQLVKPHQSRLQTSGKLFSLLLVLVIALVGFLTTGCSGSILTAEQRTFLDLSLNYLGEYQLPKVEFENTVVGGLSALTYDRQRDRFYVVSDDRSQLAPARFYTLNLILNSSETGEIGIEEIKIEDVTFLKDENGNTFTKGSIDPEGIALSPKGTVFISSEGDINRGIAPSILEFDLETGRQIQSLRLPQRYLPNDSEEENPTPRGIQNNLGFESLSLEPIGLAAATGDPFRLFTATESALFQDSLAGESEQDTEQPTRIRMMQYLIGDVAPPMLVTENLYLLDYAPDGSVANGLTDLVTLDTAGHFLSLERTYGLLGNGAKIFQLATGGATDTSNIVSLNAGISNVKSIKKQLLLNLTDQEVYLDNLEGISLGPRLADGSQSLLLVSDDNFREFQVNQFILCSLTGLKAGR
ncbi:MAG: esterase-like activity of phytase family protein [Coleofasciculaceae cyanobacterium]